MTVERLLQLPFVIIPFSLYIKTENIDICYFRCQNEAKKFIILKSNYTFFLHCPFSIYYIYFLSCAAWNIWKKLHYVLYAFGQNMWCFLFFFFCYIYIWCYFRLQFQIYSRHNILMIIFHPYIHYSLICVW